MYAEMYESDHPLLEQNGEQLCEASGARYIMVYFRARPVSLRLFYA